MRRDPKQRPTAKEALNHKWLSGGDSAERAKGKPLQETVVQRIQVGILAECYAKWPLPLVWPEVAICVPTYDVLLAHHGSMSSPQRFNQANLLKRTIFELIAQELLQTLMPESREPSTHGSMRDGSTVAG
jgi:hypothetical protein